MFHVRDKCTNLDSPECGSAKFSFQQIETYLQNYLEIYGNPVAVSRLKYKRRFQCARSDKFIPIEVAFANNAFTGTAVQKPSICKVEFLKVTARHIWVGLHVKTAANELKSALQRLSLPI